MTTSKTLHIDYDRDIRKPAKVEGFAAFDSKNTGLHHVRMASPRMAKLGATSGIRRRTDDQCNVGHWCAKCACKGHKKRVINS